MPEHAPRAAATIAVDVGHNPQAQAPELVADAVIRLGDGATRA